MTGTRGKRRNMIQNIIKTNGLILITGIAFLTGLSSCSSKDKVTFENGIGFNIPKVTSLSFSDLEVILKTNHELLGLEFTLLWDDQLIEIGDPEAGESNKNMNVRYKKEKGRMRVIMFSFQGDLIQTGGSIIHLPIKAKLKTKGETVLGIESAVFAGRNGASFELPVFYSSLNLKE
jgi:hypothetical protein